MPAAPLRHPRVGVGEEQHHRAPPRPRGIGHHSGNDAMIIASAGPSGVPARWMGWRQDEDGGTMSDRTYRVTEIVGTSAEGVEPAIRNALHRAAQTLRHLDWFEVTQVRGQIVDGNVAHYQVGLKVGFRLEDD
jgi:dodecin